MNILLLPKDQTFIFYLQNLEKNDCGISLLFRLLINCGNALSIIISKHLIQQKRYCKLNFLKLQSIYSFSLCDSDEVSKMVTEYSQLLASKVNEKTLKSQIWDGTICATESQKKAALETTW